MNSAGVGLGAGCEPFLSSTSFYPRCLRNGSLSLPSSLAAHSFTTQVAQEGISCKKYLGAPPQKEYLGKPRFTAFHRHPSCCWASVRQGQDLAASPFMLKCPPWAASWAVTGDWDTRRTQLHAPHWAEEEPGGSNATQTGQSCGQVGCQVQKAFCHSKWALNRTKPAPPCRSEVWELY